MHQDSENTLIDIDQLKNYPDNRTVIITTGSQGESMAALNRMASNQHKRISIGLMEIQSYFHQNPIPGNEKAVTNVINELLMKGADVIFQDVCIRSSVSGRDQAYIYAR